MKIMVLNSKWSFKEGLGDTIVEKFESFYVKTMNVKKELNAGQIVRFISSRSWWDDMLQHTSWVSYYNERVEDTVWEDESIHVANIKVPFFGPAEHDKPKRVVPLCISDIHDGDWFAVVCEEGIAKIDIEDFR